LQDTHDIILVNFEVAANLNHAHIHTKISRDTDFYDAIRKTPVTHAAASRMWFIWQIFFVILLRLFRISCLVYATMTKTKAVKHEGKDIGRSSSSVDDDIPNDRRIL